MFYLVDNSKIQYSIKKKKRFNVTLKISTHTNIHTVYIKETQSNVNYYSSTQKKNKKNNNNIINKIKSNKTEMQNN